MSIEDLEFDISGALLDEEFEMAVDIASKNFSFDSLVLGRPIFELFYDKFQYECYLRGDCPALREYLISLSEAVTSFNFELGDEGSFLGCIFHTSFSDSEIDEFIEKGAQPAINPEGTYKSYLVPLMNPNVTYARKRKGLGLLRDLFPSFFNSYDLGRAIPDRLVSCQQPSLWLWGDSESKIELGEMNGSMFINDVDLLLEYGADLNAFSDDGHHTAVMRASMAMMPEALDYLLAKGADLNLANKLGHTALMYVSGYLPDASPMNEAWEEKPEHLQIAKLLVEAGADLSAKNNKGQTAIDLARKNKNTAVLKYLESV